jgi:Uma2 family endonuclease
LGKGERVMAARGPHLSPPLPTTAVDFWQYHRSDDLRDELLDGEYRVVTPPAERHQKAIAFLVSHLCCVLPIERFYLDTGGGTQTSARSVLVPDISVRGTADPPRRPPQEGPLPVLVVEVISTGSAHIDRGPKRDNYEGAAIPEYWIVDLSHRCIERWQGDWAQASTESNTLSWQIAEFNGVLDVRALMAFALGE